MFTIARRICTKTFVGKVLTSSFNLNAFATVCSNPLLVERLHGSIFQTNLQCCRYKSKNKGQKPKQSETESEESEEDFVDGIPDKNTKTLKVNVTSMRLDVVLKSGLGLSRNKLETNFYESKIRLNGEKVLKKSVHVKEGDEIDVIKGTNLNNKSLLTVARVEILSAIGKDENISVKIRRCKSLTVENYDGRNRWEE